MGEFLIGMIVFALFALGDDDEDKPDEPKPDGPIVVPPPIVPKPDPVVPVPGHWIPGTPEPPKPGQLADVIDDYPTDGSFYQVRKGDVGLGEKLSSGIAARAITQRAYLVAKANGASDEQATQYAKARNIGSNRLAYWRAVLCEPWNDHVYGTFGYGPQAWPGPHGRSIRLLPQHANQVERLAAGLAPIRSIRMRTPNDAGKGNGLAASGAPSGHLELLWLPEIDAEHLWTTGQIRALRIGPPQWVTALGVDDRSGAPQIEWGC